MLHENWSLLPRKNPLTMIFAPVETTIYQPDYKAILESMPGSFAILLPTDELRIVAVSDEYLRATHTTRNDMIGKPIFDVFPANPDDPNSRNVILNLHQSIDQIIADKKPHAMEIQRYDIPDPTSPTGEYTQRYWRPFNSPVLDQHGEIQFIIHCVEDVTAQVTSAIEHDQAISDLKTLKIQNEDREQFVALLSHDLRNPLSAARANAQMIARTLHDACKIDPQRVSTLVNRIVGCISRADQMISNFLDVSRIKTGEKLALDIQETGLYSIIGETLEELSSVHGNRFVLNADPEVNGYWSREGLRRVIENLANNAVKYGFPHTPITVSIRKLSTEVCIEVHNEGHYLDSFARENLFKPFHRGESKHIRKAKGWGLGLTLVRGITESHGGHVEVESSPGKGVTFKVFIPKDARPFQVVRAS